jgi:hypothetical protein
MITKCANPSCPSIFQHLRGGALFLVGPPPLTHEDNTNFQESCRQSEYFWLCERCALTMTIVSDRTDDPRMKVVPSIRLERVALALD